MQLESRVSAVTRGLSVHSEKPPMLIDGAIGSVTLLEKGEPRVEPVTARPVADVVAFIQEALGDHSLERPCTGHNNRPSPFADQPPLSLRADRRYSG